MADDRMTDGAWEASMFGDATAEWEARKAAGEAAWEAEWEAYEAAWKAADAATAAAEDAAMASNEDATIPTQENTKMVKITATGRHASEIETEDRERASDAAEAVLAGAGVTADAAQAEYMAQWVEFDDEDRMTGLARIWIEARQAADVALTETWAQPAWGDVFCEISA